MRRSLVRPVTAADLDAVEQLLATDPVAHAFVASRVQAGGADPWRLGGDLWGYLPDGHIESLLYLGANLVPVATTSAARAAFADRLRQTGRRSSSFVGPAEEVLDFWRLLEPAWGPARDVRANQPLMALTGPALVDSDDRVMPSSLDNLDVLLPACIDMFIEEVGVSPVSGGSSSAYRARVAELVRGGRSLCRLDGNTVVFKAEIGIVSRDVTQIQGVYVDPAWRRQGISIPAMATVANYAREHFAPTVSLYVNDYNTAARKTYARVGFETVGTFATILF